MCLYVFVCYMFGEDIKRAVVRYSRFPAGILHNPVSPWVGLSHITGDTSLLLYESLP